MIYILYAISDSTKSIDIILDLIGVSLQLTYALYQRVHEVVDPIIWIKIQFYFRHYIVMHI